MVSTKTSTPKTTTATKSSVKVKNKIKKKPQAQKPKAAQRMKAVEQVTIDNPPISSQALDIFGEDVDSSDDSESDGIHFEVIPKPSAEHIKVAQEASKHALELSKDHKGSNTLYIGHIPHGFYEPQMKEYFSQFGQVTRLRLSRNRKTGAAKHYAFVEFDSADVADIVQRTMDKYLIFGHILQVRLIPQEQLHKDLWKGANRRFKKIPWGDIHARKNALPQSREVWRTRIEREELKRNQKKKVLAEYGYEFEMPTLKQVDSIPQKAEKDILQQQNVATIEREASNTVDRQLSVEQAVPEARLADDMVELEETRKSHRNRAKSNKKQRTS